MGIYSSHLVLDLAQDTSLYQGPKGQGQELASALVERVSGRLLLSRVERIRASLCSSQLLGHSI